MAIRKNNKLYVPDEPDDSTDHLDLSKAVPARFPNLKLSTETISLRMPSSLLELIKIEANKRDVPYQSLIKIVLAEQFDPRLRIGRRSRKASGAAVCCPDSSRRGS